MIGSKVGRVFQISTSDGGVPKRGVPEALIKADGIEGDTVQHPKIHGGSERAVCLYSLEKIHLLQEEGHPIFPGAVGENLTLSGIDWTEMVADAVLTIGEEEGPRLQLIKPVSPCNTIAAYFKGGAFRRIDEERRPGWARWYARVVQEGPVRTGDTVRVEH